MSRQNQPTGLSAETRRRLQHGDYTVAIICPMGVELSPVLALLDETHEHLSTSRDQNAYELGMIGQHNVVVATMPVIGNNAAAMVITQLLNDFGRVRFGLLVGVGGGMPDEDYEDDDLNDIRLGDVVVSESQKSFGGVVQFDRGKSTAGSFVRTGHLNKPPHILASSVEKLKAIHNLQGNKISQYLDEMLERYPQMEEENYSHPGPDRDYLFQASYPHGSGNNCKKCDLAQTIKRKQRKSPRPRVHYGLVGSSNLVIEDAQKRDELRDSMGILCVEMEAAGLMEAFPCLVVRGISDYADSHKNKRWQPYAAATAAAYTKELLSQIPPEAVDRAQTITDALQDLSAKVDKVHRKTQSIERRTQTAEEREILEWLSPEEIKFSSLQNASQQARTPGTGQWLLNDSRYQDWRDRTPGLLWLRGAVGCGKTILCSTVIRDLQEHVENSLLARRRLAYWYFRFNNIGLWDIAIMLRSIIRQLSCSPLPDKIQSLRNRHSQAGSEPSLDELTTVLDHILGALDGDVYIVFDALDECPHADQQGQRKQLLETIENLVSKRHANLHLLATSRPEPDIRRELGRVARYSFDIEDLIKTDVEKYVEKKLADLSPLGWDEDIKEKIRTKLLSFPER